LADGVEVAAGTASAPLSSKSNPLALAVVAWPASDI
jgi:hypothetical protein